ncbi:MAG: hypothetical protein ABIR70_16330 [Bryobacteraceae bacterium]
MRKLAFFLVALIVPTLASAQSFPSIADVSKTLSILKPGMEIQAITVDATGNVYLAGTSTLGFTGAANNIGPLGDVDLFVIKTNATVDSVLYATAIGGSGTESLRDIKVDTAGNLYILANTSSRDLPNTSQDNALVPIGTVVMKLNATGAALTYSAQLSSQMTALAMDIDSTGAAYIVGSANAQSITTTAGALKPAPISDALPGDYMGFVVKLGPSGALPYQAATYFGAANRSVEAVSVRSNGIAILTTGTLTLLNTGLSQQISSAATGVSAPRMAFDAAGNIYVAGPATLTGVRLLGSFVITKYSASLTPVSVYDYPLLSSANSTPRIVVTPSGRIVVFGQPTNAGFPTLNASQPCLANIAAPNGVAGLPGIDTSGGLVGTIGAPIPPDQGFVVLENGTVLHAGFTPMLVAQTAVAPTNGRIYLAVSETIFGTPRTTWNGVVRLNVEALPTAKASPSCVVHGASFNAVRVSPGAIMTIFGSNMGPTVGAQFALTGPNGTVETTLGGTSVTVDGKAAPMLFSRQDQINFIVPWTVRTDGTAVPLCVTFGGSPNCVQVGTTTAVTGAFQRGTVTAALNQDFSIHETTNGAAPGTVVQLFMTGFGAVDGTLVDGGVAIGGIRNVKGQVTASTQPPPTGGCGLFACASATGGYKDVGVGFAGAAPSLVLGVNQVNITIPPDMPSGLQTFTISFKPTGATTAIDTNVQLQIK